SVFSVSLPLLFVLCLLCPLPLIRLFSFFFACSGPPRDLHSFPTRRSSDLRNSPSTKATLIARYYKGEHVPYHTVHKVNGYVWLQDRKSTRLNSSHVSISYAVFCLKKKNNKEDTVQQVENQLQNQHTSAQN